MARIFQTGLEPGSSEIATLGNFNNGVVTTPVRGSWSAYAWQGGGLGANGANFLWETSASEFYCGFGWYASSISTSVRTVNFVSPNGTVNTQLRVDPGNHLQMYRGDGSATLGSAGTTTLLQARWYYIEVYVLISDTVGKVQVKIDNVDDVSLTTGLDTRADAAAGGDVCDRIGLGDSGNAYFDDVYVNDTTSAQNTGFSGDTRISAYIPNAAGTTTNFSRGGTDSGANWSQVDERPPNDATDYVFSTNTTDIDLYNIPNTSGISTVQAITEWIRAQKSDATSVNFAHVIRSGGTNDVGADVPLSTSWAYYRKTYNIDPTDSAAWTTAKLDALEIGVKSR